MHVSTTHDVDRACKDLIGEAYEAAYEAYSGSGGFSGIEALWDEVEEALKLDLSTTGDEDIEAMTILEEVFEEACTTADEDPIGSLIASPSEYVDYKRLWERLCAVIGVST